MNQFRTHPCALTLEAEAPPALGWKDCADRIRQALNGRRRSLLIVECYHGVAIDEAAEALALELSPAALIRAREAYHDPEAIARMVHPDVTDDRLFGFLTRLTIDAWFDRTRCAQIRRRIEAVEEGLILIIGTGASFLAPGYDLLVYADMPRWEIQQRMRRHEVDSLGLHNKETPDWMLLYKQGYFVDWRVCDRLKRTLIKKWNFLLETTRRDAPRLIEGAVIDRAFRGLLERPFSLMPFFDPGPWGGQWMKRVCGLDETVSNYAWCFNCVPEENSLLIDVNGVRLELPAIDLVFFDPRSLLGDAVHARFGAEFPIRFDFLDTMGGGNLSLQVHPDTDYMREHFGLSYTQDESYYIMDAEEGAHVFLGLKEGIDPSRMLDALEEAQTGAADFDADAFVETWPVRKHDHVLIPGGTVHCSGRNAMVLEISATPYIFTFKLWDWGRLGLDGRPRPINIGHGMAVIDWHRTTEWTRRNLINRTELVAEADGWREEKTGLHEREFIETRRHRFTSIVRHRTEGSVNVICLVEGEEVIVESPAHAFDPFIARYAETFIVPACIGEYTIAPHGTSSGKECITIKARVRIHA